jgi:hypothetical protein
MYDVCFTLWQVLACPDCSKNIIDFIQGAETQKSQHLILVGVLLNEFFWNHPTKLIGAK